MFLYFYSGTIVICTTYFIVYALKNKSVNDDDFRKVVYDGDDSWKRVRVITTPEGHFDFI